MQSFHPRSQLPQTCGDLAKVDGDGHCKGLDAFAVEKKPTLSQQMIRLRNDWLGSNQLCADFVPHWLNPLLKGCDYPP